MNSAAPVADAEPLEVYKLPVRVVNPFEQWLKASRGNLTNRKFKPFLVKGKMRFNIFNWFYVYLAVALVAGLIISMNQSPIMASPNTDPLKPPTAGGDYNLPSLPTIP